MQRGVELDLDAGMPTAEPDQRGADERFGQPGRNAQAHCALRRAFEARGVAREASVGLRHLLGGGHQQLGAFGRDEPVARPIEESRGKRLFHRRQPPAQRRRVQADGLGRRCQSSLAIKRQEELYVVPARSRVALHSCNHDRGNCALPCI
jgi:hypothetical protein